MASRTSTITRTTKETDISLTLEIDGTGKTDIDTGIPVPSTICSMRSRATVCSISP